MRVERDWFRTDGGYRLARKLVDEYDPPKHGDWFDFVVWATNYDIMQELAAYGVPEADREHEAEQIHELEGT